MTFSKQILDFYFSLPKELPLPNGVKTIYPFENDETREVVSFSPDGYSSICIGGGSEVMNREVKKGHHH